MSEGVEALIVGPGAMGCLHAALLAQAGVRVGLLDHRPERAARIAERGVILEREDGQLTVPVRCSAEPTDFHPAGLAIMLVKAYDTETAMRHALPALADDASVLTLQNGLGNYERIAQQVPPHRVLAGTTTTGATLLGEGHVREAGRGFAQVGSPAGASHRVRQVVALLLRGGIDCRAATSIDEVLWAKAIVNAAINPLTALTGLRNGRLVELPELLAALRAVADEAGNVARMTGVFMREDIGEFAAQICRQTAQNRSSMLQDVLAGRRTEIDFINGEIARRGEQRGVPVPLCTLLTALVHGLEAREEVDA
ncbi:MAG: ketopantoate reductase family protein [Armatimonadota bacterium]